MQNFIAQSMRRFGLAPENKREASNITPSKAASGQVPNAPMAHMEVGSKWSYSTLQYPADIQSRTDLGHYMMFYINVPNNTEYGRSGGTGSAKGSLKGGRGGAAETSLSSQQKQIIGEQEISKEAADGGYGVNGKSWEPGRSEKVIDRKSNQGTASDAFGKPRTKRTTDSIVMYMPPALTTNYAAGWKENELGGGIMEGGQRILSFMNRADAVGGIQAAKEALPGFAGQISREAERGMAKLAGEVIGGDALGAYDKISNRAMNNFLEATFTGVGFRKFSYNWKFAPKNIEEVKTAENIIRTFKFHMLPELPDDQNFGRYYVVPSEFDIFYMFRGDENTWMNKIQTCVLQNMEVNYAPNGYSTFRPVEGRNGAPPTEIDMKLDFMETKIITKAEVLEGF